VVAAVCCYTATLRFLKSFKKGALVADMNCRGEKGYLLEEGAKRGLLVCRGAAGRQGRSGKEARARKKVTVASKVVRKI
jgi:hypothetical protein